MTVGTIEAVTREARARGFANLEEAARAAVALLGITYPDPDACRHYERRHGALSRWMAATWAGFFAAYDRELEIMGAPS